MGPISDIARGERDFIHGDVDNLSDPRNWPFPKKTISEEKKPIIKEEEERADIDADASYPDEKDKE